MFRRTVSSLFVGAWRPGTQFDVTRTAVKPASRSCVIFAFAVTRSRPDRVLRRAQGHRRPGTVSRQRQRQKQAGKADECDEGSPQRGGTLARVHEDSVRSQLGRLPTGPGVYCFATSATRSSTSARRSPFGPACAATSTAAATRVRIEQLVDRVGRIEVIVTQSEAEALHLEQNLVKRHRPPFNVRLRDDKSFPYIAVTVSDPYPRDVHP